MTPTQPPPIRLAFGAAFWRLFLTFLLLFTALVLAFFSKRVPPNQWLVLFLFVMPMWAAWAFFLAATLTVLADLVVRLVIRPRTLRWLSPRADESFAAFHLDPSERTLVESPARMAQGRSWAPGRLVLTDRRLLFLPNAWDVEPWSARLDRIRGAWPAESPRSFWGFVRGMPPRLGVAADGEPYLFALLDAPAWTKLVGGKALDPTESLLS
jgi:hypothetical protein